MSAPTPAESHRLDAIRRVFFQECEEQLAELESGLMAIDDGACDAETINRVFRAVHSIKGGASIFDLDGIVNFGHVFESVLAAIRAGQLAPEGALIHLLLRAADVLADLVRDGRDGAHAARAAAQALLPEFETLLAPLGDDEPEEEIDFVPIPAFGIHAATTPLQTWRIRFSPHASFYKKGGEPLLLLRELRTLGALQAELDQSALAPLDQIEADSALLSWTINLETNCGEQRLREIFAFFDDDCDLEIALAEAPMPLADVAQTESKSLVLSPSIRVDVDRIERLVDLVSEVVIAQAMLAQALSDKGPNSQAVAGVLEDIGHLTRDLQEGVMAIRTQPVKTVFQRMSRLVRELEASTGKQIRLSVVGENTEVDRSVIERLVDPLTHMIRNAVDHGIEAPERRAALGKPLEGALRISAGHRAGRILVEVADDGAGLDRARVQAIAVARGIVRPDATLSEAEIDDLIFAPGFSTSETVSDISGRGVGLDVVRRGVESMGGRLWLASRTGKGCVFSVSLPLTLAVLEGMVVSAGGHCLVAPLTSVVETIIVRAEDIRRVGPMALMIGIRGVQVPLFDLSQLLGFSGESENPLVALVVEDQKGARMALAVDDILGQNQVVIKSLESHYRRIDGVAAATILGDGAVALILDIDALTARTKFSLSARAA